MAMVGVDSGSLYRRTYSLNHLAWSWVSGCLAPFYIHQMNRVNSRNDDSTINIVGCYYYVLLPYYYYYVKSSGVTSRCRVSAGRK